MATRIADENGPEAATRIEAHEFPGAGAVAFAERGVTITDVAVEHGARVHPSVGYRMDYAGGSCVLVAQVDDTVLPGVASAPSVRWGTRAPGRRNVNALASPRLTDAGGGPTFYSCLVEVERIGD